MPPGRPETSFPEEQCASLLADCESVCVCVWPPAHELSEMNHISSSSCMNARPRCCCTGTGSSYSERGLAEVWRPNCYNGLWRKRWPSANSSSNVCQGQTGLFQNQNITRAEAEPLSEDFLCQKHSLTEWRLWFVQSCVSGAWWEPPSAVNEQNTVQSWRLSLLTHCIITEK